MKKTISLIAVLVLIMALAVPAFAAQSEVEETHACYHTWGPATTSTIWATHNSSQCKKTVVVTRVCTKCAEIDRTQTVTYPYHDASVSRATCDGTTQTWTYTCPNCGAYRYTDWITCPGGPRHPGGCMWLPV